MQGREYTQVGWGDAVKLVVVVGFVGLMFTIGMNAETVGRVFVQIVDKSGSSHVGIRWEWDPTPTREPWKLTEADLDYQRVLMNWAEKPGFGWLVVYFLVSIVGIVVVLHELRLVVDWLVGVVRKLREVRLDVGEIGVAVSGTVRISAASGVIYLSGLPRAVVEGMEEYASMWFGWPVVVKCGS